LTMSSRVLTAIHTPPKRSKPATKSSTTDQLISLSAPRSSLKGSISPSYGWSASFRLMPVSAYPTTVPASAPSSSLRKRLAVLDDRSTKQPLSCKAISRLIRASCSVCRRITVTFTKRLFKNVAARSSRHFATSLNSPAYTKPKKPLLQTLKSSLQSYKKQPSLALSSLARHQPSTNAKRIHFVGS